MSRRQNPRDAQNCRRKTKKSEIPRGISEQQTNGKREESHVPRILLSSRLYCRPRSFTESCIRSKERPLAGFTAGRELHPALKNPDIRLCKAVYRFAQIKYIPVCSIMQVFFHSSSQTVKRQGRPKPSPPWEEYKRKEKDRSSITGNSIAQRREIQSKRKSNL